MSSSKGKGNWLVIMKMPDMRSQLMGRYRTRGEAEHTKQRLMRLTGNRCPLIVMFEQPEPDLEAELAKMTPHPKLHS
ncbi:hypothetical protein HJG54_07555 [Leptolyngbya sp. NK1-12]|uniref:Uncharacterized protein n=1 Tax=Leptolyngbya sp. NK1-12 TaxID=2547451 RepID=A0AA97AHG5_9CYAN|nr:hypothetical protein [Leptolyngbya sp. NK1-12]WNZ22726.1 hypothetical protein HJG54_07555 [Leptolyngbya sp. NK1-12]